MNTNPTGSRWEPEKVRNWARVWSRPLPGSPSDVPTIRLSLALGALVCLVATFTASAQTLPLEIRQDATRYNLASPNGMPISITRGTPPGSDGRGPTLAQQQAAGLTTVPATSNQFRSFITFGATANPAATGLNPAQSYIANAENLNLPRGKVNNQIVLVMPRATVGAPILSRNISFLFGQVVPVPNLDEFGVLLSTVNTNVNPNRPITAAADYWLPEPYSTSNHTNSGYYWSPHAQSVFAINPGPLRVAWRRSVSSTNANPPAGVTTVTILGIPYVVSTNQYVVSGSPVKDPRLIYWTEKSFVDTGKPVSVPSARVGAVNVVYNNAFPERVTNEVVIAGQVPITTSNTLQELRTLWFEESGGLSGGQIRAYNVEGRVFTELLGDVQPNRSRQHLGFEIVDVIRQPNPEDVTVELGEQLTGYQNGVPGDAGLFPEPVLQVGQAFTFQFSPSGSPRPVFYAIRETANQNDVLVHWLEEGLQGLRWPFRFVRYEQVWPDDVAKYSHYVRPNVATEEEARATAVPLPSENAPLIDYQDPLDQPRGKLTETFAYYSWLSPQYPAHRALLRFNANGNIRFERVFSWLADPLRNGNLALPSFVSDFTRELPGGLPFGSAYVGGGFLHLTDALNAQNGSYIINDFSSGQVVENFKATFKASVRGGVQPADGFSFNFGSLVNGEFAGEEGVTDGLTVSFDLWDNGVGDFAPAISVKLNGVTRAAVSMGEPNPVADPGSLPVPLDPATGNPMTLSTGNAFVPVEIVLSRNGQMDVSYKGVKVLGGVATGYTPRTGRFGLAARTGGANAAQWIDDLAILVNEDVTLGPPAFAGSVATNLNSWVGSTFNWPDVSVRPRVVAATVNVGDRISAPDGEIGGGLDTNYLAGSILQSRGDSFSPQAYADPFVAGFEAANRGAIIPVNAVPGANHLEVWWYRKNAVNLAEGFKNSHWPAVIGRYTLQWPANPPEIVLASDDGTGPLVSLQARGSIYFQNDKTQPGYNPNEEHALVQGGQAFALRDDLNITSNTNGEYSSHPFVLLAYTEADNRPAMRPFRVLRERPDLGITFDYAKEAGAILQPPMPLPLLEKPLAPKLSGQLPKNLNTEIGFWLAADSSNSVAGGFANTEIATTKRNYFRQFEPVAVQDAGPPVAEPYWVFPTNVGPNTVAGWVSTNRPVSLSAWGGTASTNANRWRFAISDASQVVTNRQALLYNTDEDTNWVVTITGVDVASGLVEVQFNAATSTVAQAASALVQPLTSAPPSFAGDRVSFEALSTTIANQSLRDTYASFTLKDRKGNLWVYRGPHDPQEDPALIMKFYYKTLPGFFFPGLALANQPAVGTITPYLRATNTSGVFIGDAVYGNRLQPQDGDDQPLGITYRPVWPANVPVLQMAETLLTPKRGLPGVRGQTSLEIFYQQSQIDAGEAHESAVLHDPTREKSFELGELDNGSTLDRIPPSVRSQQYQGKTYFPALPPHLAERLFFDPNRGAFGELVFRGQFVNAALGDKYVFLNVVGEADAAEMKALCATDDDHKSRWDTAIDGLSTTMELFIENPAQPGTYIPSSPETVGAADLARVRNDDVAVDSYAMTAVGPGVGYVTLIAGNGRAFTPEADPVSVKIVKVVNTLYRGEVNIVESSNPLNEKLTLQQVVDLAGKAEDYNFEWLIASPVDGLPPVVYQNTPRTLLADGTWRHLRFPSETDTAVNVTSAAAGRVVSDVGTTVTPVSRIVYNQVADEDSKLRFSTSSPHGLVTGNRVSLRKSDGREVLGTVHGLTTATAIFVEADPGQNITVEAAEIVELNEQVQTNRVQSIVYRQFTEPAGAFSQYWLSLELDDALGAVVYLDGQLTVRVNTGTDDSTSTTPPGGLFPLSRAFRLSPSDLAGGVANPDGSRTHTIAVELFSPALAAQVIPFNVRLEAFESVDVTAQQWIPLDPVRYPDGVRAILGGTADVRSLADNYLIMRYQARNADHASFVSDGNGGNASWSQWTTPQLAEGWIKRVLKGINPFNQRITDLFNNSVNTEVSLIAQAGARWEGDVALNLDTLNSTGLIEIYETVLNRGKLISIGGGINYGPANDALLLAAGYLNDLYMAVGNEAWADAANPTIGIGTKDNTYGDIATALFSFKGQLPSLLDEELALLRGRDDFLLPGVELRPVYNRLLWNYTRGIDSGEVIYALNYNVLDQNTDGVVNAEDARRLFPQGHGDAYGHYLTALKGYYNLLLDPNFTWVPRIEAVTVLGKPVSVDYQDERKFAAAAGAVARSGKQIFDLTWRKDYLSGRGNGWSHFAATRANTTTRNVPTTRYWGMDHWASRTGQGAYLNWVVGNAILPDVDPDPTHADTIQQVDRTTVPELKELPAVAASLQTALDNAEGNLTPLGLPESSVPFDLNPNTVTTSGTHFEQVYGRAKGALQNALSAFDDAKDVTRLLRSEQDSLTEFRTAVDKQELAYTNTLIELYGTPYTDDIGPGRTFRTGYAGPDLIHYTYVDSAELTFGALLTPGTDYEWTIDTQTFTADWLDANGISDFNFIKQARNSPVDGTGATDGYLENTNLYVKYNLSSHGFFAKPENWTGQRVSPGKIQQAISDIIKARNAAYAALYLADAAKYDLDWVIQELERKKVSHKTIRELQTGIVSLEQVLSTAKMANEIKDRYLDQTKDQIKNLTSSIIEAFPTSLIAGLAAGGDLTAPARGALLGAAGTVESVTDWQAVISFSVIRALDYATETSKRFIEFSGIAPEQFNQELRDATSAVRDKVYGMNNHMMGINHALQALDDARRNLRSLVAEGDRIQAEREIFRRRAAAVIQGYRTRDAAFRIFRNEKLERYKTLFDLASQYSFMAAQAYDYETGLLGATQGREFINSIVRARALGVVRNGQPQFGGSETGDPGLSSALARMEADWQVLSGRLGFNNPDAYGTTLSLRTEAFRILPGTNGTQNWKDILSQGRRANLLDDPDVRRYCLQLGAESGLPEPGIILEFSTTIADGLNLFGQTLAAGDHAYSPSSFATKIFAAGVALEGYLGMDDPSANSTAVQGSGGSSPADPNLAFLDPDAMAATPYIYLVPVGVDSMRSPPLGDQTAVRTWKIDDVAIPLPFNIGGSDFSTARLYQSADSLSEQPFAIRKHQAFRPVSSAEVFDPSIYTVNGGLQRSQFTNNRLIGRSVWNSKWKIVIPGRTLLNNPDEGLERFIRSVRDVKLHFVTYSYSGN